MEAFNIQIKQKKQLSEYAVGETIKIGDFEMVVLEQLDGETALILKELFGEENLCTFKTNLTTLDGPKPYEKRIQTYTSALITYGEAVQLAIAVEELSECQKEICKFLRGYGNIENLAEEIADATIMLEQMRFIFGLNDLVCQKMDEKIVRLDARLSGK